MNCTGKSEGDSIESCHCGLLIIPCLKFRRRHLANRLEQPARAEPIHPGERRELRRVEAAPGLLSSNHLGLEEPDDRFGQGVVIRITATADGGPIPLSAKRSVYRIERYCVP